MSDWDDDEPLGYGRPPRHARFKKGQSGNPRGRPKKKRDPEPDTAALNEQHAILRAEINRKVKVTEGGEVKEVSIQEAITKSQAAQAVKGSPFAQREILNRIDRLAKLEARGRQTREELEQISNIDQYEKERLLYEHFAELKESQAKAWAEAEASDKSEPDFPWPHPDDILLDKGRKQYRLRGPMDSDEVPLAKLMRAERDLALARVIEAIMSERPGYRWWAKVWGIFVRGYDLRLPLRWQIGLDWVRAAEYLYEMTPRQLEREIEKRADEAELRKRLAKIGYHRDGYKVANDLLWPLLDRFGYRSLAQFSRAFEDTDGNPPWPRKRNQPETIG